MIEWLKKNYSSSRVAITTTEAVIGEYVLEIKSYDGASGKVVCEWCIWTEDGNPIEWPGGVCYGLDNAKKAVCKQLEEYLTNEVKPMPKGIYGPH